MQSVRLCKNAIVIPEASGFLPPPPSPQKCLIQSSVVEDDQGMGEAERAHCIKETLIDLSYDCLFCRVWSDG